MRIITDRNEVNAIYEANAGKNSHSIKILVKNAVFDGPGPWNGKVVDGRAYIPMGKCLVLEEGEYEIAD